MSPKDRGVASLMRSSWLAWIVAFVFAAALILVAYYIFHNWDPNTYWRAIGGVLLQFAFIVILGAGFGQLLQASSDARTAAEEDHAKRLEFLRRLRAAHVQVAHSQKLMRIHDSGRAYREQHRVLMRTSPMLDEIFMDLREARNLFGEAHEAVTQAVEDLIEYLRAGEAEYERCY